MIKFYYISFIVLFASNATSFLYTNSNLKLVYPKFKLNTKTLFMANDGKDKRRNNENRRPQFPDKRGSDLATTSGNPIRIARISRALRDELSRCIKDYIVYKKKINLSFHFYQQYYLRRRCQS